MKKTTCAGLILTMVFTVIALSGVSAFAKERIFILTDIENEPDDAQSLVRFLTYANQFDVEGLVATTSIHQQTKTAAWRIKEIVEAYGGRVTARSQVDEGSTFTVSLPIAASTEGG